jgi:Rrf2 family transcriptional regulator, nitric oxide-sensitive transcriptional repressor
MKVAQSLVGHGLVKGLRGRRGGLILAKAPGEIRMGQVVRMLETDVELVACLGEGAATCVFTGICRLTGALRSAMDAFIAELDRLTLADLAANRAGIGQRLELATDREMRDALRPG